jgi:hypothetical protein
MSKVNWKKPIRQVAGKGKLEGLRHGGKVTGMDMFGVPTHVVNATVQGEEHALLATPDGRIITPGFDDCRVDNCDGVQAPAPNFESFLDEAINGGPEDMIYIRKGDDGKYRIATAPDGKQAKPIGYWAANGEPGGFMAPVDEKTVKATDVLRDTLHGMRAAAKEGRDPVSVVRGAKDRVNAALGLGLGSNMKKVAEGYSPLPADLLDGMSEVTDHSTLPSEIQDLIAQVKAEHGDNVNVKVMTGPRKGR